MLRHIGLKRTFKHNLRIAGFLSFVAGGINVLGFIMIGTLTTNVTGHFALFSNEIVDTNLGKAFIYFMYVFSFFFGSFIAAVMVEIILKRDASNRLIIPLVTQSILLSILTFYILNALKPSPDIIACVLLFSMGMQNSLVTIVSNSIVRTTHLTGLFTDLGIELGQTLFHKKTTTYQTTIIYSSTSQHNLFLLFRRSSIWFYLYLYWLLYPIHFSKHTHSNRCI